MEDLGCGRCELVFREVFVADPITDAAQQILDAISPSEPTH